MQTILGIFYPSNVGVITFAWNSKTTFILICHRSDRQTMAAYGLDDVASKSHTNYDAAEDPTVTNNFATVAFRFAHPMIQGNQGCEWNERSLNRGPESRPRLGSDATFFLGFMFEPRNRRELSNFAQSRSRSCREDFSSVRDPARSLSRPRK